jgi:hypothetical protein
MPSSGIWRRVDLVKTDVILIISSTLKIEAACSSETSVQSMRQLFLRENETRYQEVITIFEELIEAIKRGRY